jgi:glycerophosphoryl diester phosphodiesterase
MIEPLPLPAAPFVVAHRAGNDLAALRAAETAGVGVVEADLWLFRNLVDLRHHRAVWRLPVLVDGRDVRRRRRRHLGLRDLLDAAAPETQLLLDLKGIDRRLVRRVLEEVERHSGRIEHLSVCSRRWRLLDEAHRLHPELRIFRSAGNRRELAALWPVLERAGARTDGVSVRATLLDAPTVERMRAHGLTVFAWTVASAEQARRLASWGVHGLIADAFETIQGAVATVR